MRKEIMISLSGKTIETADYCSYEIEKFHEPRIKEMVEKRNEGILKFCVHFADSFFDFGVNEITCVSLIGNPNRPVVVFNKGMILSLDINNFNVSILSDFKRKGEHEPPKAVFSIDLNYIYLLEKSPESFRAKQVEVKAKIVNAAHRELYKIVNEDGMYYVGDGEFSYNDPWYYFSYRSALEAHNTISGNTIHDLKITNAVTGLCLNL